METPLSEGPQEAIYMEAVRGDGHVMVLLTALKDHLGREFLRVPVLRHVANCSFFNAAYVL